MRIIRHAGYSPTNFNNDIGKELFSIHLMRKNLNLKSTFQKTISALLRMDREVKFTNQLKPVCLPTRGKSFSHLDVS